VFSQQDHQLSVNAVPYGTLPLGKSGDFFNLGFGTEVSVSFIPDFLRYFGLQAGGDIIALPLDTGTAQSNSSVRALSGSAGPMFRFPFGDRFSVFAQGKVGYYYWGPGGGWDAGDSNGGGLTVGGGAGALFRIAGPFTVGAGVAYDFYSKLYNGFSFRLAVRLDFPGLEKETGTLKIQDIRLQPLFPVLYSYYDNHPVGTVQVQNTGKKTAEDVAVEFFVERYMDNPMKVGTTFNLGPGETKTVDLYALFTDELMEVTEGTKASAKVSVTYPGKRDVYTEDAAEVLEFYNRNAMTWDDDAKIASFITAKDPEIMNFAKNVVTWMQEVKNPAVDENLQKGITVFEAVREYGIQYEIDPTTPFSEFSEDAGAIDFLQFPRQTLQYTNGDCDDLTALYTSMLEAVGVETAFITVPGHIYAAFTLKGPVEEVKKTFSRQEDLIFTGGKAWLPVEITMFQDGFREAWQTGAKEWREHSGKEQAALHPTRQAWDTYQAVGFKEGAAGIQLPNRQAVTDAVSASVQAYVEREIFPQVEELEKKLAETQGSVRYRNKLAVVYARYGLYDKALKNFEQVLSRREYSPALTNVANIHFIRQNFSKALEFYNRALARNEGNTAALVGVARCNHEMENYGLVKQTYAKIRDLDPAAAERFAYLDMQGDTDARASAAAELKTTVLWDDEEE
jgi:hypothetical protein